MAGTNCDTLYKCRNVSEWTENSRNTAKRKSSTHGVRRVWDQDSCTETIQFPFGSSVEELDFDDLCGSLPSQDFPWFQLPASAVCPKPATSEHSKAWQSHFLLSHCSQHPQHLLSSFNSSSSAACASTRLLMNISGVRAKGWHWIDSWGATEAPSTHGSYLHNPTKTEGKQELQTPQFSYSVRTHLNPRFEVALVEFIERTDRDMA